MTSLRPCRPRPHPHPHTRPRPRPHPHPHPHPRPHPHPHPRPHAHPPSRLDWNPHLAGLDASGLQALLLSSHNELFDPTHADTRALDGYMNHPLTDYFIATSHNSYLTGDQFRSNSDVRMYELQLRMGCRCVEIDCWDGADGEPDVKHGRTMTSAVKFEDVISAIERCARAAPPAHSPVPRAMPPWSRGHAAGRSGAQHTIGRAMWGTRVHAQVCLRGVAVSGHPLPRDALLDPAAGEDRLLPADHIGLEATRPSRPAHRCCPPGAPPAARADGQGGSPSLFARHAPSPLPKPPFPSSPPPRPSALPCCQWAGWGGEVWAPLCIRAPRAPRHLAP